MDRGPSLARGAVLGRYAILRPVGAGGMGVVYRAYDTELERVVAIKVLHDHLDAQFGGWLLEEARALARLEDPHIVPIHDVGIHNARLFIVMRFVDGVPLRKLWLGKSISTRMLLRLFDEVAAGLQTVHTAGMLHRDLKPDNIMVDAQGAGWLVDFGLAQLIQSRRAVHGPPSGTRRYMAPERLAGAPASQASDQYALCATFLEAFERVRCPRSCRRALERGLRVDPGARFESVAELRRVVGGAQQRRRSTIGASLGCVAMTAWMGAASLAPDPPVELGRSAWEDVLARPRVASSLQRLAPEPDSATTEALAAAEDDWMQSGRQSMTLRTQEDAARSRERQACFDRLAREFDTTLFTHAELGTAEAEVAEALDRLESPQQCVQPWLPRTKSQVPSDPALAARVETLRTRLGDASMLIDLDSRAAADQISELREEIEATPFGPLRAEYLHVHAWATMSSGHTEHGVQLLEEAYFAALEVGEVGLASWSLAPLVRGLVELGQYQEARIWARRGLADTPTGALDSSTAADRVSLLIEAALVARKLVRLEEAGAWLSEAEALVERVEDDEASATLRPGLYAELARYHTANGNSAGAIAADLRVLAGVEASFGRDAETYQASLVNLARTARGAGDLDIARGAIEELDSATMLLLDQGSLGLARLQGGALELAEGNALAAWDYVEPALELDLPPTVEAPLRALAFELAIELGHRDPFGELDAGLRAASTAGDAEPRLRRMMLDAASRQGYSSRGESDDVLHHP